MLSKSNMYKIWRSKQHTGFCGTRVQVGKYSGLVCPDEKCPNCGRRETAEHILICPHEDRTRLLADSTDDLSGWLNQEYLTDLELAYWIPKYILMRGDKPFASLGTMSPRMRALAVSQDKIGWRNFMEGFIHTLLLYPTLPPGSLRQLSQPGQSPLSPYFSTSLTRNGSTATSLSMTSYAAISTTNLLRTSNRPLRSWRKRPRKIYPREASFYSK
jgi:hypothetical protein